MVLWGSLESQALLIGSLLLLVTYNTMKKILYSLLFAFVLGCGIVFFGNASHKENVALGSDAPNKLSGSATVSTGTTITTASASILAASSGRQYAIFTNDSTTIPIYLSFTGSTAAVANKGVALEPLQTIVINLSNQYVGQVNAITASSTAVLTVTAFQ